MKSKLKAIWQILISDRYLVVGLHTDKKDAKERKGMMYSNLYVRDLASIKTMILPDMHKTRLQQEANRLEFAKITMEEI